MKVFLVGDFPKDEKTYGGVEGVLINLANELMANEAIDLVLVATSLNSNLERFKAKCNTYKLNFRGSIFKARKEFYKIFLNEKPNVIHLQGVVPGVLLYKKAYQRVFVVTQHAVLSEERIWQVSLKRKLLFKLKELVEHYYLGKIKNIIFISEYNKNRYLQTFSNKQSTNYALIVNPVNKVFLEKPVAINEQFTKEMYFVGEIKKRKGLHVLLHAMHILKLQGLDLKLNVIGGFKEEVYEKEIHHLITTYDLKQEVIFCGWKKQSEVIEFAKKIPVFVLPSFQETLPLSIAEALCQGKIVVATDICGIPEMIDHGHSGYLFPKGDHEQLALVLKEIFTKTELHEKIAANAIAAGSKYHSITIANSTIEFYKTL